MADRSPKVVAFGGGHGLAASLSALRRVTGPVTAIVTVADDGGSSGRLRRSSACCRPATCGWRSRRCAATTSGAPPGPGWCSTGSAATASWPGHSLGNLLIAGLWDLLGDPVAALDWVGRLLRVTGRVLPMAAVPLDIVASVEGLDPARPTRSPTVRGQAAVAVTPGRVRSISLLPPDPPAVPEAVAAVREADWVVFGPGSWFTSRAAAPARAVAALRADRHAGA